MLKFDSETLDVLNVSYRGADITRRRIENMAALAPRPGERILDLGCGQGLMTEELARAVGPEGEVFGVDPSQDMRAEAEALCARHRNVRILDGSATSIPVADESLDAAISLQVFEYVDDLAGALAALREKLRPGGRLAIGDMQWSTLSWASDEPERMLRMCRAWERHVAEPDLPAALPAALARAGFALIEMRPLVFSAVHLRPDGLAYMMMHLMRAYVVQNGLVPEKDATDWFEEQILRAREGRFFFSLTHFVAISHRI